MFTKLNMLVFIFLMALAAVLCAQVPANRIPSFKIMADNGLHDCLMFEGNAKFELNFTDDANSSNKYVFDLAKFTKIKDIKTYCSVTQTNLALVSGVNNDIKMTLIFKNENKRYFLSQIDVKFKKLAGMLDDLKFVYKSDDLFKVDNTKSYMCRPPKIINFEKNSYNDTLVGIFSDIKLDAFRPHGSQPQYRQAVNCQTSKQGGWTTGLVVLICALIGSVIVGTAVYIVKNR